MSRIKIVLIPTENWTMRPVPDVADLVRFAIEAERAGLDAVMVSEHIVLGPSADAAGRPANPRDYALPGNQDSFGPIWVEPPPARPGGPDLWFGGSSLHPRAAAGRAGIRGRHPRGYLHP